ncbi:MAG: hypothetical protein IJU53_07350 [Thermoguttaceae bacterium]|nr:hypothetical protein [Thermoguttaceae bacterium]
MKTKIPFFLTVLLVNFFAVSLFAEDEADVQAEAVERALWDVSWERFFVPQTHTFYDYLTSWEPGQWQKHLPTPEEIQKNVPNEFGYDTGMEDGMIFAGTWMEGILARAKTAETAKEKAEMKRCAHEILLGVKLCTIVHSDPGFVARAVCPADGRSVYPGTSRDQYTHAVHGLWHYSVSELCDEKELEEIAAVLSLIADRMIRNVTPANRYDSLNLDGKPNSRGIARMWDVDPHEAARLPMIYAAAWDVCRRSSNAELKQKSETYYTEYRKYIAPAVEQSLNTEALQSVAGWAMLQAQASLELLRLLETDPVLRQKMEQTMEILFDVAAKRLQWAENDSKGLEMEFLFKDWRVEGGGIPWATPCRKIWYNPRQTGEAAMTQLLCPTREFPAQSHELLRRAILRLNPDRVATSGIFYLVAAWEMENAKR